MQNRHWPYENNTKHNKQIKHCQATGKTYMFWDNSVSLRRIGTKRGGNSSYKPPGVSYTAQGPQKQKEIGKHLLV